MSLIHRLFCYTSFNKKLDEKIIEVLPDFGVRFSPTQGESMHFSHRHTWLIKMNLRVFSKCHRNTKEDCIPGFCSLSKNARHKSRGIKEQELWVQNSPLWYSLWSGKSGCTTAMPKWQYLWTWQLVTKQVHVVKCHWKSAQGFTWNWNKTLKCSGHKIKVRQN